MYGGHVRHVGGCVDDGGGSISQYIIIARGLTAVVFSGTAGGGLVPTGYGALLSIYRNRRLSSVLKKEATGKNRTDARVPPAAAAE